MRNKKLIILLSIVFSLVLVIIVCGATFLVRDVQAYSYYVDSPKEFDKKVISAAGIELNSSMFFLDEPGIKNRVESKCADVVIGDKHYGAEVINIERKFPDKVSINYVVHEELFQYRSTSGEYFRLFSSGRISRKVEATFDDFNDFITVRLRDATTDKPKAYFQGSNGFDRKSMKILVDFMHTVNVMDKNMSGFIDFIDFSYTDGYFSYMYIKTSAGCAIELYDVSEHFHENLDAMLHEGWSAFADKGHDTVNPSSGKISVYMKRSTAKPVPTMVYAPNYIDDDYARDYLGA